MDIKKSLIEFGFSKNEAAVYLALLELGTTQAGPLVNMTRLHRMKVYNALEKFVEEGYCTIVRKKNIKMFTATDPSALQANIKRKEALVAGILPNLKELQQKNDQLVDVRTLVGHEGFQFHIGAIRRKYGRPHYHGAVLFQFHIGAIRSFFTCS